MHFIFGTGTTLGRAFATIEDTEVIFFNISSGSLGILAAEENYTLEMNENNTNMVGTAYY